MKSVIPILAMLLFGCDNDTVSGEVTTYTSDGVEVIDPVIRLPAVPGRPASGYFIVSAPLDRVALTAVSSPRAERIEMHETTTVSGRSSMRPITRQEVRHQDILFAPGARHLMIFGLDPALRPGDRAELTFRFQRGEPITVSANVIGAGDDVRH